MRQCPSCGRKNYNNEKYCPSCHYYLSNVKEESNSIVYNKSQHTPIECPYCHSTNTQKISTTSKLMHTAIAGVFAIGRNSKQWHCNNCQSDF